MPYYQSHEQIYDLGFIEGVLTYYLDTATDEERKKTIEKAIEKLIKLKNEFIKL